MIYQQSGETVTKYFDGLKQARVNVKLSKGNVTKKEELDKSERDYGNNNNPEKLAEDKWISLNVPTL